MRNIVNPMLPSPGRFWMLNTAFASTVPFDFLIGDTYPTGTGLGGFAIPDIPPNDQFAFVCVWVAVHFTVNVDSLTRGPPALTRAESSKFLPVAVEVVDVASVFGSVTVVVQDDVPPPKVIPVFWTTWAVAVVGPSTEHLPWVGTVMVEPALVNSAEPMVATPGCGPARAGVAVAASPATNNSVPARAVVVVRMSLSSLPTGRAAGPQG
ncbi:MULTISPECIES: hypothetical protein [unclassified Amycolatopsis]|uniref:hypothetical protein n=1 Tax=unclassified Amycolatopsis TaxID=2618356 RepID=UPI001FF62FF5|nr:hypothetical protein [Amycolatopsis sp. FBCC-B4732]UOX86705.1 hypothetical protein MUY14_33900 [Amycolatopsis sp. FBCC-B4732]